MKALRYIWKRRTTAFGYVQVTLGVLAISDGIFSPAVLKWIIFSNALLLAVLGHYNNRKQTDSNRKSVEAGDDGQFPEIYLDRTAPADCRVVTRTDSQRPGPE